MPLFDFHCRECGHEKELLVFNGETPSCPACGSAQLEKLLSRPVPVTAAMAPEPMHCGATNCCRGMGGCGN